MRKALIDSTGKVVNVIEIEADSDWKTPDGHTLLTVAQSKTASPGDTWDGTKIVHAVAQVTPKPRDLEKEVDDIKTRLAKLE